MWVGGCVCAKGEQKKGMRWVNKQEQEKKRQEDK
jgi:hypothetical protein